MRQPRYKDYPDLIVVGEAKHEPWGWEGVHHINLGGNEVRIGAIQRLEYGGVIGKSYPQWRVSDRDGKQISIVTTHDSALRVLETVRRALTAYKETNNAHD